MLNHPVWPRLSICFPPPPSRFVGQCSPAISAHPELLTHPRKESRQRERACVDRCSPSTTRPPALRAELFLPSRLLTSLWLSLPSIPASFTPWKWEIRDSPCSNATRTSNPSDPERRESSGKSTFSAFHSHVLFAFSEQDLELELLW